MEKHRIRDAVEQRPEAPSLAHPQPKGPAPGPSVRPGPFDHFDVEAGLIKKRAEGFGRRGNARSGSLVRRPTPATRLADPRFHPTPLAPSVTMDERRPTPTQLVDDAVSELEPQLAALLGSLTLGTRRGAIVSRAADLMGAPAVGGLRRLNLALAMEQIGSPEVTRSAQAAVIEVVVETVNDLAAIRPDAVAHVLGLEPEAVALAPEQWSGRIRRRVEARLDVERSHVQRIPEHAFSRHTRAA